VGSSGRVRVLLSKAVDRGFIGGIMVSVLVLKAVDCGFIGAGESASLKSCRSWGRWRRNG
jgi:predicted alpha/beta hydrolase